MIAARVGQGLPVLTHTEPICNVRGASAKSEARSITPVTYKAQQSPSERLFCCSSSAPIVFMVGLIGPTSVGPVSLYAGGDNPVSPATNTELSLWVAGSLIQGACIMALFRLAVLTGTGTQLRTRKIQSYQTITATSYKAARSMATSQNAIITGWRVSA